MKYWHCETCKTDEPINPSDFLTFCKVCDSPMQILEVSDKVINEVLMKKLNEVRTKNPNTGTLIEVVQRKDGKGIVEKVDHHEGGTYEASEQEGTRSEDFGADSSAAS